jgi:hypothetical protein
MGLMQRHKRYRLEAQRPEKRTKVYADVQRAQASYIQRAIAAAKYMQKVMGVMHQVRNAKMSASDRAPSGQVVTLTNSTQIDIASSISEMAKMGVKIC